MAATTAIGRTPVWRLMRMAIWGGAGLLLLLPLVAMQCILVDAVSTPWPAPNRVWP